ncbi:hypothetical protein MMC12_006741 [Toensbergia leucococca]|nr:hypothetical protein [Toensbergia leucococca]
MATTREGEHSLQDGNNLYTKTWIPQGPPAAILVFVHGFSDHCNCYYNFFPTLALSHDIQVHAFDQRGWGRSVHAPSERGLTGPTSQVLADISSIVESQLPAAAPVFLMGHSMGGQEVLYWAARGPSQLRTQITGYLAESPWIALHPDSQPNKFTIMGGRLAAMVAPKLQMLQKLDATWKSRDESVRKDWVEDELCHDTGTLEGLSGMLQRADELNSGKIKFKGSKTMRLWLSHGSGDRITSFDASKRFVEKLDIKDKEFKKYEGWYHALHAEPGEDRDTFAKDVARWILARVDPPNTLPAVDSETKSKL